MKRFYALVFCLVFPLLTLGAITAPVFTTGSVTNTQVKFTLTTLATETDSVAIMYLSGSDTLMVAYLDSATVDTTVTAMTPGAERVWLMLARQSGGQTAVSLLDTLRQEYPPVEASWKTRFSHIIRRVFTADSWLLTSAITDSLVLNGTTAIDSSIVYYPSKFTGLRMHGYQAGDSVNVRCYVYAGKRGPDNTFEFSLKDSLDITSPGTTIGSFEAIPPSEHVYLRFDAQVGNGKNTSIRADLISDN